MTDLTEAVDAAARHYLQENYSIIPATAMRELKEEFVAIIAPAYHELVAGLKEELEFQVERAYCAGQDNFATRSIPLENDTVLATLKVQAVRALEIQ